MVHHYRIIKKIGAGGMGEIYLAEDTKLKRQVAAKFLPSHLVSNQVIHKRFVREAQTLAKLNHPNIVSVHDVSEFENRPFYVMELVEGESLQHFAEGKQLHPDTITDYAIQICQGLGEAHRAGIVHRDIKSANIAVDKNGRVKLLDFGLAANEEDDKLTKSGSTLGTVSYMSPEQVSGRDIDQRSDLFSFGIVLYELISGKSPFKRDSEGATLNAIMQDTPEPLSRYKSNVSEKLQEIVSKLLEKDKELRYQSAEGVIADLKRLMYDSQPTGQVTKQKKSSFGVAKMIGIGAVILAIIAAVIWRLSPGDVEIAEKNSVPMIAVKPFENLGAAEDEYFADGITDEITSRLAGIEGLGVISRTSAMKYKDSDKNLKLIGAELGVDFVLEGTVRWSKVGERTRVRITPQLVRVSDDRHLWADNYERELLEVFAVQADIAEQVVEQLGITLVQKDRKDLNTRPTESSEAYSLYLRALSMSKSLTFDPISAIDIKKLIDSAVFLDSDFALAVALQSQVYSWEGFGRPNSTEAIKAKQSAERSLKLIPGLPQGRIALGTYYNLVERDYDRALEEFNMAKSELHNDADLLQAIALVQTRQGHFAESAETAHKATELDPLSPDTHALLSLPLWFMRLFEESNVAITRAISLEPKNSFLWRNKLALLRSWKGDKLVISETTDQALKYCDTLDLLPGDFDFLIQLPDLPWGKYVQKYKEEYRSKHEEEQYYLNLSIMGNFIGDSLLMKAYGDSLRMSLEKKLAEYPNDFERTTKLGAILAMLGECDKAVEFGRKGVEMMTVEGCHW